MTKALEKYAKWLHCRWPAGVVEKLPAVDANGQSNVPGLYVVGDLTGIPLLKFSSNSGALAVRHMAADSRFQQLKQRSDEDGVLDVTILGAGVSGMVSRCFRCPGVQRLLRVSADHAGNRVEPVEDHDAGEVSRIRH